MTPKLFIGLWVAAVIAVIAAGWSYISQNTFEEADASGALILPEIVSKAKDIVAMDVTSDGETLKLARVGKDWKLASRADYPADLSRVRDVVIALSQMRKLEAKTANPEKYTLLNLEDPSKGGTGSSQVTFLDEKGGEVASIILGKVKDGLLGASGDATYVRLPDNPQTWLASGKAQAEAIVADWVDENIYKLDPQKISKITVTPKGGVPLVLEKQGDEYIVLDVPDPTKLKDTQQLKLEISPYAGIVLLDVRKAKEGGEPDQVSVVEADGTEITLKLFKEDKGNWLTVTASGDSDEAKAVTAKTAGWQYKIPPHVADGLSKTLKNYLKDE